MGTINLSKTTKEVTLRKEKFMRSQTISDVTIWNLLKMFLLVVLNDLRTLFDIAGTKFADMFLFSKAEVGSKSLVNNSWK